MKAEMAMIEPELTTVKTELKVSVIMPTYNRASMIMESIRSVLGQSFTNLELIIVDDGSTDGTGEIVASYLDPRIKYFRQNNLGVVAARNSALEHASGEYIFFLDSDDVLMKNAMEKAVRVLDGHPEAGFCFGQAYLMDDKQRVFGLRRQGYTPSYVKDGIGEIEKAVLNGNHIPTSTILVRRECLEKIGFFNKEFGLGSEDFELWIRLARLYSVAYIAEPLIKYRVHNGSITSSRSLEEIEKHNTEIIERILNDPEISLSLEKSQPYFRMLVRLAQYAYGSRQMKISRDYVFRSLKLRPDRYMKALWLPLIIRLLRTWIPQSWLDMGHSTKHFVNIRIYDGCFWLKKRRIAGLLRFIPAGLLGYFILHKP
jgi:glycosyltransferase involved in cell wall biosynthesis